MKKSGGKPRLSALNSIGVLTVLIWFHHFILKCGTTMHSQETVDEDILADLAQVPDHLVQDPRPQICPRRPRRCEMHWSRICRPRCRMLTAKSGSVLSQTNYSNSPIFWVWLGLEPETGDLMLTCNAWTYDTVINDKVLVYWIHAICQIIANLYCRCLHSRMTWNIRDAAQGL